MKTAIEIERKYVILMPDENELSSSAEYTRSNITQTYLASERGVTHRVRARETGGVITYTENIKRRIDEISSYETEGEISEQHYDRLRQNIAKGTSPLSKVRHTFVYSGQLFEVDVYPEWKSTAILETELESRDTEVKFPEFIRVLRDVSGMREYSNRAMSERFPPELV